MHLFYITGILSSVLILKHIFSFSPKHESVDMQTDVPNDREIGALAKHQDGHPQKTLVLLNPGTRPRTTREAEGRSFDNVTDPLFRRISVELSRRFPDTPFCTYPADAANSNDTKYCLQCSCEDMCDQLVSCCSDIQSVTDTSYRYVRDNYTVCKNLNGTHKQMYEFVERCPGDGEGTDETRLKCEGELQSGSLEDWEVVPVFDQTTNKNYLNIHCAFCHKVDVDNLVYWAAKLDCREYDFGTDDVFAKPCRESYIPSNDIILASTACYDDISKCNVTGRWEAFDDFTEQACRHLRMRYRDSNGKRYKNVFCALCNGETPKQLNPKKTCSRDPGNMVELLSVLVQYDRPAAAVRQDLTGCPRGMKFDPLTGNCHELHCSWPLHHGSGSTCAVVTFIARSKYAVPVTINVRESLTLNDLVPFSWIFPADVRAAAREANSQLCNVALFYKTNIPHSSLLSDVNKISWSTVPLTGVFMIIKSRSVTYPTRVASVKQQFRAFKDSLYKQKLYYTQRTYGGDRLFKEHENIYKDIATDPWFPEQEGMLLQFYHENLTFLNDGYNGTVTVKHRPYMEEQCMYFQKYHDTYGVDFLQCPAFVYNMTDLGIVRFSDGLILEETGVKFGFAEFRSINESHVKICAESVFEKMAQRASTGSCSEPLFGRIVLYTVVSLVFNM